MFYLGNTSRRRSKGVNPFMLLIVGRFLEISPIDITIPWMGGVREAFEQYKIFLRKASKADGYKKLSFHQSGDALDLAAYVLGKISNSKVHSLTVVYYMLEAYSQLKEEGAIPEDLYLHSGIFWGDKDLDGDGFLTEQDKLGWDARHFEFRGYPQKGAFEIKL